MIITQTPLRISIGGGGTDLPAYYEKFGASFISAAINKYIYIGLHKTFQRTFLLKYSQLEQADSIDEIKHPIVREALRLHGMEPHLEIMSMADIPAGTGLGSSGAFTVGLLKAIYCFKRENVSPMALAEEACRIEMELLKEPVGKQDQYIASVGGFTRFEIDKMGRVSASPLRLPSAALHDLEDNLMIFFTGVRRSASEVLSEQQKGIKEGESRFLDNLHAIREIGEGIRVALENGDCRRFGELMDDHWRFKNSQSKSMSNSDIGACYELARKNGAVGGKLIGAGGGGFLMFYAEDRTQLRAAMLSAGLEEVRFGFDFEGAKRLV